MNRIFFCFLLVLYVLGYNKLFSKTTEKLNFEELNKSVVYLEVSDSFNQIQGTGFFISENLIVTNYHILNNNLSKTIIYCSEQNKYYEFDSIYSYSSSEAIENFQYKYYDDDITILRTKERSKYWLKLSKEDLIKKTPVITIGHPQGRNLVRTLGEITSIKTDEFNNVDIGFSFNAPISHGSSGSPVISTNGLILGIGKSGNEDNRDINYATSYNRINWLLNNPGFYSSNIAPPIDSCFFNDSKKDLPTVRFRVYSNQSKTFNNYNILNEANEDDIIDCIIYYHNTSTFYTAKNVRLYLNFNVISNNIIANAQIYADNLYSGFPIKNAIVNINSLNSFNIEPVGYFWYPNNNSINNSTIPANQTGHEILSNSGLYLGDIEPSNDKLNFFSHQGTFVVRIKLLKK